VLVGLGLIWWSKKPNESRDPADKGQ